LVLALLLLVAGGFYSFPLVAVQVGLVDHYKDIPAEARSILVVPFLYPVVKAQRLAAVSSLSGVSILELLVPVEC